MKNLFLIIFGFLLILSNVNAETFSAALKRLIIIILSSMQKEKV